MLGLRKMVLGETTRGVVMIIIYLVFFVMLINSAIHAPDAPARFVYLVMLALFGGVGLLSEYLRFLYRRAIKTLVIHCQSQKALEQMNRVERADILRSYRNACTVFRTLALVDQNRPQELLDYIEGEGKRALHSNKDMLLVYYYNQFYGNFMLGNGEAAAEVYPKLQQIRFEKRRKLKVAPVYNWEILAGDYYLSQGDASRAKKEYEPIPVTNLNNRERAHFYLSRAKACAIMGHHREQEKYAKLAREVAPNMPCVQQYEGENGEK